METIGIFLGAFMEYWDEKTVANGMGGSETWAIEVGKQFAAKGYKVIMYAYPEEEHEVVPNFILKRSECYFKELLTTKFDYFIFSRITGPISPYLNCQNVYVMVHDTVLNTPQDAKSFIGLGKVKAYCYLSDWHKQHLLKTYGALGLNEKMLYKVSNGFSREYYEDADINKKENIFVWSSSLLRGFDLFYKWVFLPVLINFKDVKLYVCTGTIAPRDSYILENAKLLPGVEVVGKLSKKELADLQKRAKLWVYPGIFPETFCITAVENGYAGNAIISPLSFGLKTTIGDIPYLQTTNLPVLSKETADQYINSIINLLTNDDMRKKCAEQCKYICSQYSWERTTDEFINLFNQTKQ